jgi:hypothetical protein
VPAPFNSAHLATAKSAMNQQLKQPIQIVMEHLVAGTCSELETITRQKRLNASEMAIAISSYGRKFVLPPEYAYEFMEVVQIRNADPPQWFVEMALWTHEEGRSDLSIEVTITARENGFEIELDDIRVL